MYKAKITGLSVYNNKNGKPTLGVSVSFTTPEGAQTARVHNSLIGGALPITQRMLKDLGVTNPADLTPAIGKEVTIRPLAPADRVEGGDVFEIVTEPKSTPEGVAALGAGW